jgi:hypothetical protein
MQGFLMMGPDKLGTGAAARDKYLRLWVHEVGRREANPNVGFHLPVAKCWECCCIDKSYSHK